MTLHLEQRKAKGKYINDKNADNVLCLAVNGTTDKLAGGYRFLAKKVKVEHPIDKGYFKEAYILTDMGKARLKRLKIEKGL